MEAPRPAADGSNAPDRSSIAGKNRLLAALPRQAYRRLVPKLEPVLLDLKEILYRPNEPIPYVYFPINGVISLLTIMEDGAAAEVGITGNEGMVGLPVFLGTGAIPGQAVSQIPGDALRLRAEVFREEVDAGGPLHALLQRYTHALFAQIAQSAACNRLHPIGQRCARWLLMMHDRVGADRFPLPGEFLAQKLGVRRAAAAEAVSGLQRAGTVTYKGGRLTVINRERLEAASCECYRIIRQEYDRVLGQA